VVVWFVAPAARVDAALVGNWTDGWMTWFLTEATAPQDKARANVAANAQPAASLVHFGISQLSHAGGKRSIWKTLENSQFGCSRGAAPALTDSMSSCRRF